MLLLQVTSSDREPITLGLSQGHPHPLWQEETLPGLWAVLPSLGDPGGRAGPREPLPLLHQLLQETPLLSRRQEDVSFQSLPLQPHHVVLTQ